MQLTIGCPRCGPCNGAGTPRRGRTGQPPPPRSTGARPSVGPTGSASNPSLGNRNCSSVKDTTREHTQPQNGLNSKHNHCCTVLKLQFQERIIIITFELKEVAKLTRILQIMANKRKFTEDVKEAQCNSPSLHPFCIGLSKTFTRSLKQIEDSSFGLTADII